MHHAAKRKTPLPARLAALRCLLLLVVACCGLETRLWSFAATPPTASGEIALTTPSFIGENYDALPYDASDSLVATKVPANSLVGRILGKLDQYPHVVDARTGRHIPFPSDIAKMVPQTQRVSWGAKERSEFIAEWYRRGYETPRGGWENYDIHHIKPREFGGGNNFWNLVPVERQTHQNLFNDFWREFTGP